MFNSTEENALQEIAFQIKDKVFAPIQSFKTKVFLCGAALDDKKSLRYMIDFVFSNYFSYRYEVIYPEDLFDELLSGQGKESLLSLENMLAESVDVVILIPESAGSFAELGAFANSESLRKKILCIQDSQRKKEKSFLNYGPIRLIRTTKMGEIVSIDYSLFSKDSYWKQLNVIASKHFRMIRSAINRIEKKNQANGLKREINLLDAEYFILPCMYLFENIDIERLIKLFKFASRKNKNESKLAVQAAINVLSKKKLIARTSLGYTLTEIGRNEFKKKTQRKNKSLVYEIDDLDSIRIEILNWTYRNKTPFFKKKLKALSQSTLLG